MLEAIIAYLKSKVEGLDQFAKIHGLCELVENNGKTFPAFYKGKGEYKQINDYDFKNGVVYFRKTGEVTQEEADLPMPRTFYNRGYPVRAVAVAPRDILDDDTAYIADKLADNLSNVLASKDTHELSKNLSAQNAEVALDDYTTDADDINDAEFGGEMQLRKNYVYIAVDVTVTITASKACFEAWSCGGDTLPNFNRVTVDGGTETLNLLPGNAYTCDINKVWNSLSDADKKAFLEQTSQAEPNIYNHGIPVDVKNKFYGIEPIQTGQTESFANGDDGDFEYGRLKDFFTLKDGTTNPHGTQERFTDGSGNGLVNDLNNSARDTYIQDWATRYGLFIPDVGDKSTKVWSDVINAANNATNNSFTDWFIPNSNQLYEIGTKGDVAFTVFGIGSTVTSFISSTTRNDSTGNAYVFQQRNSGRNIVIDDDKSSIDFSIYILFRKITQQEIDAI